MIFQYAHLLKGSIRLARFHPDSTPARISLTLEHEQRYADRNVHFTALAYEPQASDAEMSEILLQGRTRRVPQRLWQALSALVDHHDTSGRFWIDYVCINQNNEAEKHDHKSRLADIHASADEVLLWLGVDHDVAGAEPDMAPNCSDVPSYRSGISTGSQTISPHIIERLQLQQAKKVVLIQGEMLAEVWRNDPHSAL
ncbi:uncharacterized protein RCC_04427 [Ramularia collo-cygni]|uniref:Heterokaryon incompatibility domain-containing protein n=1 Tax=Ramularia collo-cygni TaxID=112498 RepID=A0A2D3VDE4_9PEZI|nr:uncharacterized protein RCC_04427 [Ramularia collo-cygni]CZT18583.1 uncharacterized protein RCC_04427 [Ramularia collo-cygni]